MKSRASFWRNLAVIGLIHVAGIIGLARWSKSSSRPPLTANVVWMEGGTEGLVTATTNESPPDADEEIPPSPPDEEQKALSTAPNDLSTTPPPPVASPPATRPAIASPKPKSSPKPKPKTSPKPTAKKTLLAKNSVKAGITKTSANQNTSRTQSVTVSGASGNGQTSGAGSASENARYGTMLHDRFFGGWDQPKTVVASGAKMSALVRIRIEKDGRVSAFSLVRESGNVVVDDSVKAIAQRVPQVDPLPAGLGNGGHYDVNINFELNAE